MQKALRFRSSRYSQLRLFSPGHVGIPSMSRFGHDLCEAHSRRWVGDADEVLAGRALNLAPGKLRFTFQRLIAVRAVEFEFRCGHRFYLQ